MAYPNGSYTSSRPTRYAVDENGDISELPGFNQTIDINDNRTINDLKNREKAYDAQRKDFEFDSIAKASNAASKLTKQKVSDIESNYKNQLSQNNTYNSLADQIAGLSRNRGISMGGNPSFNEMTGQPNLGGAQAMDSQNIYGSSDLGSKLNFQVSNDQILNDYNKSYTDRLNGVLSRGNAQITGIQDRIATANNLLDQLPSGDPRRASAELVVKGLNDDLKSVTDAVSTAQDKIKNFTPLTSSDSEGMKQINSFREHAKLPEENALNQLRQIDPNSYRTAIGLGRQYNEMVNRPIGETSTAQTEDLRNAIEQEAVNQLKLGSTLGAEERRGYEQAIRGAQTSRGNVFGLGPAVQEASQIGAAGEARKLARYGAAQQFLASGQSTGDALRSDIAFRDALQQNRLGAASGFLSSGPSLYNLGNARLANQQGQFQNYINANQAQPGQFNTQPYASQFYQTTNPNIPVQMSGQAAGIYNTMSNYQAQTYGDYTRAVASQPSGAQQFAQIAGGIGSLMPSFSFSK
jgi:hypothetical protein